jgi:hypothetical protein
MTDGATHILPPPDILQQLDPRIEQKNEDGGWKIEDGR